MGYESLTFIMDTSMAVLVVTWTAVAVTVAFYILKEMLK